MGQSSTIKYGRATLTLTKSDELVALKPHKSKKVAMQQKIMSSGGISMNQTLGGFDVVDIKNTSQPMENMLDALRMNSEVVAGSHVYHSSDDGVPIVPSGKLFVVFKTQAQIPDKQKLIDDFHLEMKEELSPNEFILEITKNSPNPLKVAAAFQNSPIVELAEPELATPGKLSAFVLPSDDKLILQWHLLNSSTGLASLAGADARVVQAWKYAKTLGQKKVIVAVIDDGFDLDHPDLSQNDKIVAPRDFTRNDLNPIPDPLTHDWHGTACSGVAIGRANKTGILGAAPNCRFMPVRWGQSISDSSIRAWFEHVKVNNAWVVSCSWGTEAENFPLSALMTRTLADCAKNGRAGKGVVICFAAGNENRNINDSDANSVCGFAIHPDVIAVAASTSRDQKADYSNFGKEISVCAPSSGSGGKKIFTADVKGLLGYSHDDFTDSFGGTSSATPLVAGICALILSVNPSLTAAQVKEIIQKTARKIGDQRDYDSRGHSDIFGFGCIDALAAVKIAKRLCKNN